MLVMLLRFEGHYAHTHTFNIIKRNAPHSLIQVKLYCWKYIQNV